MRKTIGFVLALAMLCLPAAVQAQSNGFSYDIFGVGGLYNHSADDPAMDWTFVGPAPAPSSVICLDSDSLGTIYSVDLDFNELVTIDPVTGVLTSIAPLSGDIPPVVVAMCIDESTDTCYGSDGNGLWEIDLGTGACTLLSATFQSTGIGGGAVTTVFELATDSAGNFWAFDITTDNLWSLDVSNGDCTFVANYNTAGGVGDPNFSNNGMDWDPVGGRLISDVYTGGGTGSYGTWDTVAGTFTEIENHATFPAPATGAHGGPMCCIAGTTFQWDFWNGGNWQTYDTDPVANLVIVTPPGPPSIFAMEFDGNGDLQAINTTDLTVGVIDQVDGSYTATAALVGDFAGTAVGMAYDSTTDTMYLANVGQVFTLDVTTGDTVLFANMVAAAGSTALAVPVEIAVNGAGEMFMFDSGVDILYQIDLVTTPGECTEIGTLPFDAGNFIQGMSYDPGTDTIYGAHYLSGGDGNYGSWDTTTGAFTTIANFLIDLPPDADGYELKVAFKELAPSVVDLTPASFNLVNGVLESTDPLVELSASDNTDSRCSRDPFSLQARVLYEVGVTSPTDTPSAMDFTIEESVFARGNVNRTIQLFNYDTSSFETVDVQLASRFGDRTDVISVTGDPSRFVEAGTGAVLARVRYDGPNQRAAFTCNTDHIFFTITN